MFLVSSKFPTSVIKKLTAKLSKPLGKRTTSAIDLFFISSSNLTSIFFISSLLNVNELHLS